MASLDWLNTDRSSFPRPGLGSMKSSCAMQPQHGTAHFTTESEQWLTRRVASGGTAGQRRHPVPTSTRGAVHLLAQHKQLRTPPARGPHSEAQAKKVDAESTAEAETAHCTGEGALCTTVSPPIQTAYVPFQRKVRRSQRLKRCERKEHAAARKVIVDTYMKHAAEWLQDLLPMSCDSRRNPPPTVTYQPPPIVSASQYAMPDHIIYVLGWRALQLTPRHGPGLPTPRDA